MPCIEKVLMLTKRAISTLIPTSASATTESSPSGVRVSTASCSIHEMASPLGPAGPEKPNAGTPAGMRRSHRHQNHVGEHRERPGQEREEDRGGEHRGQPQQLVLGGAGLRRALWRRAAERAEPGAAGGRRGERAVSPCPPAECPAGQQQHHRAHAGPGDAEQQDGAHRPRHPFPICVLQEPAREADEQHGAQHEAEEHQRRAHGDVPGPGHRPGGIRRVPQHEVGHRPDRAAGAGGHRHDGERERAHEHLQPFTQGAATHHAGTAARPPRTAPGSR